MSFVSISYFGHSAVCINTADDKQILIDPFISTNPLCPKPLPQFSNLSAICLTHAHADHVGDTLKLATESTATVCATYELAALLAKDGVKSENLEFMNKGGSVKIDGASVTLTQAFHSSSYGEAAGLIIKLDSGQTIYHAGDTMVFSDMQLIAQRYKPDIAFLPIGDRFTMGPKEAVDAAKLLAVDRVIPIHFGTFDALTGTTDEFCSELKGTNIEAIVLEPGSSLKLEA
ncbi:UNVERIFIED_CONTAM: hypothetical protein GTU68_017533 [Idotea baltica]|nr:hypothetical protein [Idotea baltica]